MRRFRRQTAGLAIAVIGLAGGILAPGAASGAGATPAAVCGPGSHPETGIQGRVTAQDISSGYTAPGITCNTELVGRFGNTTLTGGAGGYKVFRTTDTAGHECAYYDTTLLFPLNAPTARDKLTGVYVLDMSNPAAPQKTDNLLTPAMQSPHESLSFHAGRGLLAAGMGYPTFNPGFVDIYDVNADCRHPVLRSSTPLGILGHEGNFSPDGKTLWITSTGGQTMTALDVTDPAVPTILWTTVGRSIHGLTVSGDGNRLYGADTGNAGLTIFDVSQVQARAPNPTVTVVSHITWPSVSIPQVPIAVTIGGRPYLVEVDEFARNAMAGNPSAPVGAARIIDISNDASPVVVSDIRLAVHQPENVAAEAGDPGASFQLQGYAGHYCAVPSLVDPGIVACSMILSGLRVFDIRDPLAPKEIAYFNAPNPGGPVVGPGGGNGSFTPHAAYAMSAPAFVPGRGEIWYSDGAFGFFAVRVTNGVWPFA